MQAKYMIHNKNRRKHRIMIGGAFSCRSILSIILFSSAALQFDSYNAYWSSSHPLKNLRIASSATYKNMVSFIIIGLRS